MERVTVDVAVNGHRADPHLFAGPDDPAGNFSPIGNQDFAEASRSIHGEKSKVQCSASKVKGVFDFGLWTLDFGLSLLDSKERLAVLHGLTVFDVDLYDLASGLSLNLIH